MLGRVWSASHRYCDQRTNERPASAAVPGNPEITSWGPASTKAGEVFNKQPDGSAFLWVRMNQPLDGEIAAIEFNGALLQGVISGNLVNAAEPAPLYPNRSDLGKHHDF